MSVRTDVVNLIVNVGGDKAQNELNQLRKKAADLNSEMKGLHKNTNEYKQKAAELKQVDSQMAGLRKQIGLTALSQKELTAELRRLQQLKNITTPQSKEFHELQGRIDAVTKRLYEVKNGVFGFGATLHKVGQELKGFGMLAISYLGFEFITSQFQKIISGAGKLSDQLADLRRVAGLTAEEAENLNNGLRGIDTRTSGENLRQIAIIAGKLGVAKDDILGFTKAVDMLVVSLGDELGDADQITTELGKILNVFDGKVSGDNITKLGNAIVELANAGVASGGFISDFSQRVAGIAKASNLSLGSTVGLAAGFEELGLRSESSSTALQKLLSTIAGDIPAAAKIANVPMAEFNKLFAEKPQEALIRYAEGLVKNKTSFAEITASFKDAGEEGARVVQTLQAIGQRGEFLREKINLGNAAIKENSAITDAFALKNETLGATLDKIGKRINTLFTSSGFVSGIKSLADGFASLIGVTDTAEESLAQFHQQADRVNKLERDMVPLLTKYDDLKTKTKLSKDEQVEMNKTITAIANNIPYAITKFNEYGQAIDIDTGKAREFIESQRAMKKVMNEEAISNYNKKLKDAQAEVKDLLSAQGTFQRQIEKYGGRKYNNIDDYLNKSMADIIARLNTAQEKVKGLKSLIAVLSGDNIKLPGNTPITSTSTTNSGSSAPGSSLTDADKKKAEQELENLRNLRDEILRIKRELEAAAKGDDEKEIERIHEKYVRLLKMAVGHANEIMELNKLEETEILLYRRGVDEKLLKEDTQLFLERKKKLEEEHANLLEQINKNMQAQEKAIDDEIAAAQTNATRKILQQAEEEENERKQKKEHYQLMLKGLQDFLYSVVNLLGMAAQLADTREQAELDAYLTRNDKKKQSFDNLLKAKRISQSQHDKEIAKLDEEAARRKHEIDVRQFKRHQAMAYMQAIINAAEGVTKIWSTYAAVPVVAAALTAVEAIATGIEIATIAKQEPPKGARGLVVSGPSHSEGGINMVDSRNGQTIANIEGGEPVMVLSRDTYGNNRQLIDSLIYNSMYRNGAPVLPNSPAYRSNIIPMVERNGVWQQDRSGAQGRVEELLTGIHTGLREMGTYLSLLPTELKAKVVYKDITDTSTLLEIARRNSGLQQHKSVA